ncbi:hypothetical protein Vretimale_8019 [Volvox reticuliferus]|nr:hypothetical protein Vretifemale_5092 [Volvox reticuliferus]GIM03224.1 hypothetical protein Vretimale_8019 [Volvox reticuliferus]
MQLKKAEADLAVANQEREKLRLAAEQQRGPWFDQVRAGVEERVRQALQHSQELEARFERREAEHTAQMEALREQLAKLEEELSAAQNHAHLLHQRLESTSDAKERAENRCTAAEIAAREVQKGLENLAAENRVLQESIRSMRQECTERWVKEQAAIGQVDGLEQRIEELHQTLSQQTAQLAALQRQLDTQTGINRQLMARKEEVEWQLMAAMAKIDGGAVDQPVPLNLRVSGLLQVGGPNNEQQRNSAGAANLASTGLGGLAKTTDTLVEGAGRHSTLDATSTGGAADTLQQSRPASALQDVATVPHPNPSARCDAPAYNTVQGAGTGEVRSSPFTSHPLRPAHGQSQHAGASAVVSGRPGSKGSSPRLVPNLDEKGSMGRSESLLTPEATLLIADDDLATITHRAAHRNLCAAMANHPGMLPNSRQQQSQPRQHVLREEAVASGRSYSGTPLDPPARWTSLEGASTAVSSPPSSVALSTASGSPDKAPSLLPSETSSREPGAPAVTIRTVSNGQCQQTAVVCHGANVAAAGRDRVSGQGQVAADAPGVMSAAGEDAVSCTHGGPGRLERRGSLHDGEDVWLADVVSTSSSEDSDFFFSGGVVIQHASHTKESRNVLTGGQQSQLYQLQQRLQVQLQGNPAATMTGSPGRQRVLQDAEARGALQPQACAQAVPSAAQAPGDEGDTIHVRAAMQRNRNSGGVIIRSGITMRSVTSGPANAGLETSQALPGGRDVSDQADPGIGVLSIVKGDVHQELVSRSPMHPALSGKTIQGAPCSPKPVSPSRPAEPALTQASQRMPSERALAACSVDAARPFLRESGAGMHADTGSIPLRVQAGPPFYATSGPLERNNAAVMEHWMHSTGSRGTSSAPVLPHNIKLQEITTPASPARSTASMRSPRSPVHPAIILVTDRDSGESAGAGESARKAVTASAEGSSGPSSRMVVADQAVQPRAATAVSALGAATISYQGSEILLQTVSSVSNLSEGAAAGVAEEGIGATARTRVSFHGLTHGSQAAPGERIEAVGSFISSSSGSLVHMSSGSGTQQQHKPNSVKSVRFSDHESDDQQAQPSLPRREGQEDQGVGAAADCERRNADPRMSGATFLSQDVSGRSIPWSASPEDAPIAWSGAEHYLARHPDRAESSPQYRSRGPVLHPAMPWMSTATPATAAIALEAADSPPAKRYSAAGVTTTSALRAAARLG